MSESDILALIADAGFAPLFFWGVVFVVSFSGIFGSILTRKESKIAHTIGWICWFIFALMASLFVHALVVTLLLLVYGNGNISTLAWTVLQVVNYFVWFAIMIWLPWRRWKKGRKDLENKSRTKKPATKKTETRRFVLKLSGLSRRPTWNDVGQFLLLAPLYLVAIRAAEIILTLFIGAEVMGQEQGMGLAKTGNTPISLILIGLCLVVLAPLFEEMLIRGALFSKIREKLKFWPTALLTAGVFALIHGQFNVGVMTFILALFAAFLREKTGAIWSGIMLHMTQNGIAFCLLFL